MSNFDVRNIKNGWEIPKENYCDQPYIVIRKDGGWVCVLTTGIGLEGDVEQHIISSVSMDQGKTWSAPVDIEPVGPPESSWVMPLIIPSGRIYAFYTYNGDNLREMKMKPGYEWAKKRIDTLGYFTYKYSDDGGLSWSKERYYIPVRNFKADWENIYHGEVQFFWGVGKPIIHNDNVYMGFAKVAVFGEGFMEEDEGAFLKSGNILTENDPTKIRWETLPDGDIGLRAPEGTVADEHNLVGLNDGGLYCTYRTVAGHNCHAYSRDGGHTWTPPEFASYSPNGKKIKHPRAANFVHKYSNGKYTLWFHNHGKKSLENPNLPYFHRNPAWLSGGVEKDGYIYWSQPEIVLYDDDPDTKISYPDFIEDNGKYFISETQKTIARVHEIDNELLEGLWNQATNKTIAKAGLVFSLNKNNLSENIVMPELSDLKEGGGFTIDFWCTFSKIKAGDIIFNSSDENGKGIILQVTECKTISITINDGNISSSWDCDEGVIRENSLQHISIIVDGGPKIIIFVVDGILCDGGDQRQFGWGRFNKDMQKVGGGEVKITQNTNMDIILLRIYNRSLRVSEVVGNFQAGVK